MRSIAEASLNSLLIAVTDPRRSLVIVSKWPEADIELTIEKGSDSICLIY